MRSFLSPCNILCRLNTIINYLQTKLEGRIDGEATISYQMLLAKGFINEHKEDYTMIANSLLGKTIVI